MTDFLSALGSLTLGGSIAIGALAVLSHTSRSHYAARWRCWAWVLLCLRMAIPFSLPAAEETNFQPPIQVPIPSDTIIYQSPPSSGATIPTSPSQSAATPLAPGDSHSPSTPPTVPQPIPSAKNDGLTLSLSHIVLLIWCTGAVIILLWMIFSHLRFLRYLKRWGRPANGPELISLYNQLGNQLELDRRPRLLVCPGLQAPMLAGLFRPAVLLPDAPLDSRSLKYVLLHELIHYRRKDIWLKTLALWANALHWFNPLVWYMVRLVERDTELACDEGALLLLSPEEHAAYGRTILAAVEHLNRVRPAQ